MGDSSVGDDAVAWHVLRAETVLDADGPVPLTRRSRQVLLLLLLQANELVSTDRLVDGVWGDRPPSTATNSIARFVSDLRRALGRHGQRVISGHGGYRVEVNEGELDWEVSCAALAEARATAGLDDDRCAQAIAQAMCAAGTEPNPWLLDLPGAAQAVRHHDEHRLDMLHVLVDLQHRRGRFRELVAVLESALHAHPFNEGLWAHLMHALQRSGRSAEALRAFQRMRSLLADIGLVPSEVTLALEAQILAGLGRRPPNRWSRPTTARERMMATTVDWSWDRLRPSQQLLLARLSVFRGGWTPEAAQEVCRGGLSTAAHLDELTDRFLLTRTDDGRRFDMPDAVWDRSAASLAINNEGPARRERVFDWIRRSTEPWTIAQLHAWNEPNAPLMAEAGNIDVALSHLVEAGRPEELVWLAVRCFGTWVALSRCDVAIRWLEPLIGHPEISAQAGSAISAMLMHSYRALGDPARAAVSGLAAVELAGDRSHDWLTSVAGVLAVLAVEHPMAHSVDELQAMSVLHAANSASPSTNLATDSLHRGQVDMARHEYETAVGHFRAAQRHNQHLGPLRRQSEIGEAMALCRASMHREALAAVRSWTPKPGHRSLHPSRHATAAVVLAYAGQIEKAQISLANAVLRHGAGWVDGEHDLEDAFVTISGL